jgi:hypothetical protein
MVMAPVITATKQRCKDGQRSTRDHERPPCEHPHEVAQDCEREKQTRNLNVAAHRSPPLAKLAQGFSKAAQDRDLLESERPVGCSASFIL